MSFLDHIRACNCWEPSHFLPFLVSGERVGLVRRGFAEHLKGFSEVFRVEREQVTWIYPLTGFEDRNRAMEEVVKRLVEQGVISHLQGEKYPVTSGNRLQVRMLLDRAAAPFFGVRAFGQHLNGCVRDSAGMRLWVARRSSDRRVFPNHLDNLVAGGLPWGIALRDNLRKECREEAGIPANLADRAAPVGAVTYCRDSDSGLKPDVMYCYDLELPSSFEPSCQDGEVQEFFLWPVQRVLETVRDSDQFKLNCNLAIIDFLIRHGFIDQDAPDYLDIIQGLRSPLP